MKNLLKSAFSLWLITALAFAFSPVLANNSNSNSCQGDDMMGKTQQEAQNMQQMPNLKDALDQTGATGFSQILEKTGANSLLSKGGPYTIFAPSNEALNGLSKDEMTKLKNDQALFEKTISNHIVQGAITEQDEGSSNLRTVSGRPVDITKDDQSVQINGQKVISGIQYQNGVIYVIDGVIL